MLPAHRKQKIQARNPMLNNLLEAELNAEPALMNNPNFGLEKLTIWFLCVFVWTGRFTFCKRCTTAHIYAPRSRSDTCKSR